MLGVWITNIATGALRGYFGRAGSRHQHEAGRNPWGGWPTLVLTADLPWPLHLGLVDLPVAEPSTAHHSNSFRMIRCDTKVTL